MKNCLWITACAVVLVQVKCVVASQAYSNPISVYENAPPQSFGYSALGGQQFYSGGSSAFFPSQQFGLQYQGQPFASFRSRGNAFGGRSAARSIRLQHLLTKAIPSNRLSVSSAANGYKQQNDYDFNVLPTSPTFPTPSFYHPAKFLASTPNPYSYAFTPRPDLQLSNPIPSVPALSAVTSAPGTRLNFPSSIVSIQHSVPIAEGHSVGNSIAYTYNAGIGSTLAPQPQLHPTLQSFINPSYFAQPAAQSIIPSFGNSYALGGIGYANGFGDNVYGSRDGNDFSRLFNTIYKRDAKSKISRSSSKSRIGAYHVKIHERS